MFVIAFLRGAAAFVLCKTFKTSVMEKRFFQRRRFFIEPNSVRRLPPTLKPPDMR